MPRHEAEPVGEHVSEVEPFHAPAPVPMPAPRRWAGFEDLFGRRLPIWAGGVTLAIAGVLIVKYAIDIGLIGRLLTPAMRVALAMVFGGGLIAGAEWAHARAERVADPRVAQALSGAGVATLYAAILVAAEVYALVSPGVAFAGLAMVTAGACVLALRHGAPSAVLGLVGGLAAPALVVGEGASVPLIAGYLAVAVAGIAGLSRTQRWPWLALLALAGGGGWSLALIVTNAAAGAATALSLGGLVVVLALAVPLLAGVRDATAMRELAALAGALQLALLVALGGFAPLHWGLFALIAAATQMLAWRDPRLSVAPRALTVLTGVLLLAWPHPAGFDLVVIGLALAAIQAGPLARKMWRAPAVELRAGELAGLAFLAPLVALRHAGLPLEAINEPAALAALLAAATTGLVAARGWRDAGRGGDRRFVILSAAAGWLLLASGWFALAHAASPIVAAAVASALVWLARPARDARLEGAGAGIALAGVVLLAATAGLVGEPAARFADWRALAAGAQAPVALLVLARWAALAMMAGFMAWRMERAVLRAGAEAGAVLLGYGVLAQVLPETLLPLAPAAGFALLAAMGRRVVRPRLTTALSVAAWLSLVWALDPLGRWLAGALPALVGGPLMAAALPGAGAVLSRLALPAVLFGAGLARLGERRESRLWRVAVLAVAVVGLVAAHTFYRLGFAGVAGDDFVRTGFAERLGWIMVLAATGLGLPFAARGGEWVRPIAAGFLGMALAHLVWFSLLLHDPMWSAQAVGPLPLANLLLPLALALPLLVGATARAAGLAPARIEPVRQPAIMVAVAGFTFASLRQAFHGSLLVGPGMAVGPGEDIARSILGIALAIGFLLWGIRVARRDWRLASLALMLGAVGKVFLYDAAALSGLLRIGSFVALGFSLIGIGWLYSRQLGAEQGSAPQA
jgi:uncharacterized membrane protein